MSSEDFMTKASSILNKVKKTQLEKIKEAAQIIATTIENDGILLTFGTGHSHMIAEEIYSRAGGLVPVYAILESGLTLEDGPLKSSMLEKLPGLAEEILATNPIKKSDTILIISNSGRNAVPIEMATGAREKGVNVIAITSLAHSKNVESRHPSGKKLYQVSDLVIDNCGVSGDAILEHEKVPVPFAATSSLAGVYIVQAMIAETIKILANRDLEVPVLMSGNLDKSVKHNQKMIEKYLDRLPQLRM